MGSKNRISKYILPFFNEIINKYDVDYYEPFCGGCNLIDKVKVKGNRYASDINKYLINMWILLQYGWTPPTKRIERNDYNLMRELLKKDNLSDKELGILGFIGFMCSYGGRFFDGGYANNSGKRNYQAEAIRNVMKQLPNLMGVKFSLNSYEEISPPNKSIIYCDIPYKGTKEYHDSDFDYERFYDWCRKMSKEHFIFISEYYMPEDFQLLWEKDVKSHLKRSGVTTSTEKLFFMGNFNFSRNNLDEWLRDWFTGDENHVLNGILFEIYFNSKGQFRQKDFKSELIDEIQE